MHQAAFDRFCQFFPAVGNDPQALGRKTVMLQEELQEPGIRVPDLACGKKNGIRGNDFVPGRKNPDP